MWGAVLANAAGNIAGGIAGAAGAKSAAKAQLEAAKLQAEMQKYIFDKQTELQEPFRQGGISGMDRILTYLGLNKNTGDAAFGKYAGDFSMADFQADPGYAFRLSEGLKTLDRQAAAHGGLISGAALKAATRYGQDMGSQEYMNAFNRYQTNRNAQLNPLQSLMGAGQTATNALTDAAGQYGRSMGEAYANMGNARASGYMGQANALSGALQGIGNAGMNYYMMKQLGEGGGIGGGMSGSGTWNLPSWMGGN